MLKIYTIKDIKSGAYNTPFYQPTRECAIRTLSQLIQDTTTLISQYPEDFQLYYLGIYNQDTGVIVPMEPPEYVVSGSDIKIATVSGVLRRPAADEPGGSAPQSATPRKDV